MNKITKKAENFGVRTCITRLGVVLGKNGGALKEMLPAFKWGFGGIIGSGNQWFSWVHIEDVINVFKFLINNKGQRGIFNLTSPNPVSNLKLTRAIGESLNKPTIFTIPNVQSPIPTEFEARKVNDDILLKRWRDHVSKVFFQYEKRM